MNWQDVRDNWAALVPAMQARWPELTEEDLIAADGDRDALAKALASATSRDRIEAERDIAAWLVGPMPADAYAAPSHDNDATSEAGRYVSPGEDPLDDDARFGDDDTPDPPAGRDIG